MTLGGSFLFAEGEISSERLLAGHSVLPSHNHRNPGGSGGGLCTPNFCKCRYTSWHKLNDKAEHAMLNFNAMHVYHCMITCTCAYRRASNYCIHSYIEMSVLCITLSPVKIYCAEEIEYSSYPVSPGLDFWLYKYLFVDSVDDVTIK